MMNHVKEKIIAGPLRWELPQAIEPTRLRNHTFQWHLPGS